MEIPSRLARHLPAFTLLLYIVAATVGSFTGGLWAALGIGGGIILFGCVWAIDRELPIPQQDLSVMAGIFFFATCVLNFQSSDPGISWREWVRLLTVFVPLLLLLSPAVAMHAGHKYFFTAVPIAMVLGGLALGFWLHHIEPDILAAGKPWLLAKYNRGFSYLVILAFPVMAGLWFSNKRWLIIPFLLLLLVPASLTESRSSKLALTLGLIVAGGAWMAPVVMRRLLMTASVLTIFWPFAAQQFFLKHYDMLARIPDSWHARLEIWDYMSYRIQEQPFSGWGLGTSHTLPFANPHGAQYVFTTLPASHPHNVLIQLWVELGLPGVMLGLAFVFLTLRKAGRLDARLAPFALGAWAACFCLSLIAYDFWTDSLFAAFAMTALAFAFLEQKFMSLQPSEAVPEA